MTSMPLWASALGALTVGIIVGSLIARSLFRTADNVSTSAAATGLLAEGNPELWNTYRIRNPQWIPDLKGIDLHEVDLTGINLRRAILRGANLAGTVLTGADLTEAVLASANLQGTSLRQALLDGADLTGADLTGALRLGASFLGAQLEKVKGIDPDSVRTAPLRLTREDRDEIILHLRNPDLLFNLDPHEFRELVGQILRKQGFTVERYSDRTYHTVDLLATKALAYEMIISYMIEIKRYGPNHLVGVESLRAITAISSSQAVNGSIIITTSRFTKGALEFARNRPNLQLVDSEALHRWMAVVTFEYDDSPF